MFLRRCTRRKNGKTHSYWALVESYRTAKGSRQRVVSYLGELQATEQSGWAQLGRHLSGTQEVRRPQLSLFDPPRHAGPHDKESRDDEPVLVRLSGVRFERLRDFGDVWLAWGLWRMLELDGPPFGRCPLERLITRGREEISWSTVAAILTIGRFCELASELHIEEKWYRRTALDDLLGVPPEKVHTDRLYEGLDQLLPHKDAIEKHLRERLADAEATALPIARAIVAAKIQNSRTVLLRGAREAEDAAEETVLRRAVDRLECLIQALPQAESLNVVRGCEGEAARVYFESFSLLLKQQREHFMRTERSRRPPKDRINALLSFVYSVLTHDMAAAASSVGVDPAVGFLHADRPGRLALALDLLEEFRAVIADRLVLSLINLKQVQPDGFET